MARLKLYQSKTWLMSQLYDKRNSPEQIAQAAGCAPKTIYRYMEQFGLRKP